MRILIIFSLIFTLNAFAEVRTLDTVINAIRRDREHEPFKIGESNAKKHPQYPGLMTMVERFGAEVEWVKGVSKRVLELPYNPARMKVTVKDSFDGWFDEFTTPNLIIIDRGTNILTLVHELRHVVHLGTNTIYEGTWYDLRVKQNHDRVLAFHKKISKSSLSKKDKAALKLLATRLVESCSEISAHWGDYAIAKSFEREETEDYLGFVKEYKNEFFKSYYKLKTYPLAKNEVFISDLNDALHQFLDEKKLP
jgi:hypothetical protein